MKHSIIFCGTPAFAVESLRTLASHPSFEVTLVITQPDRPVGKKRLLTPPPVKVEAEHLGIPVWQPENINKEIAARTDITRPEYLVVVAYGQILKTHVLDVPTIAPINVHASLLPRWRGASPIEHSILHGDTKTGVSIQRMVEQLDAGPVYAQEVTQIGPRETTVELKARLATLGATLLSRTLATTPLPSPTPQSEQGMTLCSKLTREHGQADASTQTAEEIDRHVRALVPWPGVMIQVDGQPLKLLATSLEPVTDSVPLSCAHNTTLHLVTVQPASGKSMSGAAWQRGTHNKKARG